MSTNAFEDFVRHSLAGASRRASLRLLAGAPLLAALGGPITAGARTSDKRKIRKKARQIAQQQCLAQVEQCRAYLADRCEAPDPSECLARIGACCEILGGCDATSFLSCLLESG